MRAPAAIVQMLPGTRAVRIERMTDIGAWRLWTSPAPNFIHGTYMLLYDDGCIDQVTNKPTGEEHIIQVRTADRV